MEREDGSLLVITGKWSEGKREYDYATLEVAGMVPGTVGPAVAQMLQSGKGKDVEDFRADAAAAWDGTRACPDQSRIAVWWIAPEVPVRVKAGHTYISSGGIPHGESKVYFYGGPASSPAYLSRSKQFQKTHAVEIAAPPPPTPKQIAVLEKYASQAGLRVPATAAGAKKILDALAASGWQLRNPYGRSGPIAVWTEALHSENGGDGLGGPASDHAI